ncbi:carbonic anhydrase [Eurytemora carolleeae]|uniref:carbonic anhydrase n=1 Tax=Eurytemora carolleeae TaxID=1294199 RepID=UPI000C75CA7A|nr:carbonic anhydrase [Eurytemora carolleeae]|eukprot:XP_023337359.1 carbonic anhydrase-like [Eurytemora affinis]
MSSSILFACFLGSLPLVLSSDWGYLPENGPVVWGQHYPTCNEFAQSPLDLDLFTAEPSYGAGELKTIGYRTLHNATVNQNGHTFTVSFKNVPEDEHPMIHGGSLPPGEKFSFVTLHLHWGSDSSRGSEHRLTGYEFPAEIHLVHWNTKYPDFPSAAQESDGLAVAGFFLQVSNQTNVNYAPVIDGLLKLAGHPDHFDVDIGHLSLHSLLTTKGAADHLHYKGSLTTPPCTENVFWNVFLDPINISEEQLIKIRSLRDGHNQPLR